MRLIDTHAHLVDPIFSPDQDQVITQAIDAGIVSIIVVTEHPNEYARVLQLAADYPKIIRPGAGFFPTLLDPDLVQSAINLIRSQPEVWYCLGEVGLDYWKVQSEGERSIMRNNLKKFVQLSLELDLPLNVHSRSSGRATLEFLLELGAQRVQMHAFDAKPSAAELGIRAGFHFSIPPSITRSPQKQKLVSHLPLESILFETDSPVLGPDPKERNVPANLNVVLEWVAKLKKLDQEKVAEQVWENTVNFYGERILTPFPPFGI